MQIVYENFQATINQHSFKFFISYVDLINIVKINSPEIDLKEISRICFEYNLSLNNSRALQLFNETVLSFLEDIFLFIQFKDGFYEIKKEYIDDAFNELSEQVLLESLMKFSKLMNSLSERLSYINNNLSNRHLIYDHHDSLSYYNSGISITFDSNFIDYLIDSFIENFESNNNSLTENFIKKYLNIAKHETYFNKIIPAALNIRNKYDFIKFINEFCIDFKIID